MLAFCRDAEAGAADRRARRPGRAGQVVEPQRPALVGLGIGRIAIDGGAEDEIVAGDHLVMQPDAVPVEHFGRAEFEQFAH